MDATEIGSEIRRARKAMDPAPTQCDVAAALGLSPATVSQIENGQATDIGLRRLINVMEYVGLELVARPARMGYTLDDAKDDLRHDAASRPRMR